MKSVLIIAHGSRKSQQNDLFFDIINMVKEMVGDDYYVDGAFMSFSEMNIEFKLKEYIEKNVTEITIVPYLLFAGNHVKNELPLKVNRFMADYPEIKVVYRESLGVDRRLAEIIVDRIYGK